MLCLISLITRHGRTGALYHDRIITGERISIGRAVDQSLFLPDLRVALQHAEIADLGGGRFLLQSKSLSGVRVNERLTQSALLKVGDVLRIGHSQIRVLKREGYDLTLEVETRRTPQEIEDQSQLRAKTRLSQTRLYTRPWSWLLSLSILTLFLAIPAASVYLHEVYQPWLDKLQTHWSTPEQFYELPSLPKLVSDRFWDSGPLASAHHFFGQDCAACHQQAFERVPDRACVACHKQTHPHVDPGFFDLATLNQTRCAACHLEHNGKKALINRDDSLCSDCHRDLSEQGISTELGNASDFGSDHPPFKPTLLGFDKVDTQQRVSPDDEAHYREASNLEFPHDVHVSRQGLETIDGIFRLWCQDCHTPEPGGAGFLPINYDKHCANCHPLSFEPMEIDRVLPHGKAGEVAYEIQAYYQERALKGEYYNDFDAPAIVTQSRFPGETLAGEDRMIALNWAHEKAESVAQEVFEFSVCVECHQVEQTQTKPPRWNVVPVRLNQSWLPKARFTHLKHLTMNCVSCHLAPESNNSAEILLPDIDSCRSCHAGVHASGKLASTCVDCHGFHVAQEFSMGKKPETDSIDEPPASSLGEK